MSVRAVATCLVLLPVVSVGACSDSIPLIPPVTLIERVVEARSTEDIVEDNRVALEVNRIMVDVGTIQASTTIYEQRLLVTGLLSDRATYDRFHDEVHTLTGVRKLYWHVHHLNEAEQERRRAELLSWTDSLALDTKVSLNLVGTRGVSDVNLRVTADSFGTVFLLGRARSPEELDKALAATRATEGVRQVVSYVEVRP